MSGATTSSFAAAGRPATVTIKTSDRTALQPSDHMLAEHDLQQATRFRGARGHIPSSRCAMIDAVPGANALKAGKLFNLLFRISSTPSRSASRRRTRPGGDGRDRTDDLMLAKQLLSQLSYVP